MIDKERHTRIYVITNRINGMQYVGKTTHSIMDRFWNHVCKQSKTKIHDAIEKYGKENFTIEEIDSCEYKDSLELEKYYTNKLNTVWPNGYNVMIGQSMSGGNNRMKGKRQPKEWRDKVAEKVRGELNPTACYYTLIWKDTNEMLVFKTKQKVADYLGCTPGTVKRWLGIEHIEFYSKRPILIYNSGRIHK